MVTAIQLGISEDELSQIRKFQRSEMYFGTIPEMVDAYGQLIKVMVDAKTDEPLLTVLIIESEIENLTQALLIYYLKFNNRWFTG